MLVIRLITGAQPPSFKLWEAKHILFRGVWLGSRLRFFPRQILILLIIVCLGWFWVAQLLGHACRMSLLLTPRSLAGLS